MRNFLFIYSSELSDHLSEEPGSVSPTWSHLLQLIMQHNNNFQEKYLRSFTSSSIMRYASLQLLMYNISNIAHSEK